MTVKSIFKTLIGTIFLMVSISVIIELFNVSITGMQIKQMVKMSAKQACVLFTQETYKTSNNSTLANNSARGATNISPVTDSSGTIYVSGNFYNGTTESSIWSSIYNSGSFRDFCNSSNRYSDVELPTSNHGSGYSDLADAFPDLEILQLAVNNDTSVTHINLDSLWDLGDDNSTVIEYNNKIKAESYKESMFTPVNLGIPYLDDTIVNKMFKWNTATILSNSDPDSIQTDEEGNMFINYKGFRVYAQDAKIVGYKYKVYNLNNSIDRVKFKNDTGMSPESSSTSYGLRTGTGGRDDNYFVTAVEIEYRVPISYIGITPIKRIFNYTWNKEVAGFNDTGDAQRGGVEQEWAAENLSVVSGGDDSAQDGIEFLNASSDTHTLDSLGKLTYVLVR